MLPYKNNICMCARLKKHYFISINKSDSNFYAIKNSSYRNLSIKLIQVKECKNKYKTSTYSTVLDLMSSKKTVSIKQSCMYSSIHKAYKNSKNDISRKRIEKIKTK